MFARNPTEGAFGRVLALGRVRGLLAYAQVPALAKARSASFATLVQQHLYRMGFPALGSLSFFLLFAVAFPSFPFFCSESTAVLSKQRGAHLPFYPNHSSSR